MSTPTWEFWIDVGGTFTDCLARDPDGQIHRFKLLSSGVVRGTARPTESGMLFDASRCEDASDVWRGYELYVANGESSLPVSRFDNGTFEFERGWDLPADVDYEYELRSAEEAPLVAIRYLLGLARDEPIPPIQVRLGTTRGTNALLTRQGARAALITTKGFIDAWLIGNQSRPRLFELGIEKPEPLFQHVIGIDERMAVSGEVLQPLDKSAVREQLLALRARGVDSLAVCLLNAYQHYQHELLVQDIAAELGFADISLSHQVTPLIKLVDRGDTTLVNAYLNPILRDYVQRLRQSLGKSTNLRLLSSAGGLVSADQFAGKDSILSGPAGGVVGLANVARALGYERAIGFDMGGTSTDVSRYDGRFDIEHENIKAGVRIVAPMMAIETVAAGGGSICGFDGIKLVVGPGSAGADPGPACYGRGGPLTVTDLNLLLGRIPADQFPFPLHHARAEQRLEEIRQEILTTSQQDYDPLELAAGFLAVANANMAKAIRTISVAKGYDPREYALVSFGGAAGQHACAIADELDITTIVSHPDAGILSAYGIGMADVIRYGARGVYQPLGEEAVASLPAIFAELSASAREEVLGEGIDGENIDVQHSVDLRFLGLDFSLNVPLTGSPDDVSAADRLTELETLFHERHEQRFGYTSKGRPIEIVTARVEAVGRCGTALTPSQKVAESKAKAVNNIDTYIDGQSRSIPVFSREKLPAGASLDGPAIIAEPRATTVIDQGWRADVFSAGEILITRSDDRPAVSRMAVQQTSGPDPIRLELFNNQFASIAEQMGITLRNTSCSVNVKERLDFSCAIFTSQGDLVVNAPHIPVHLGAMSETVKQIIADNRRMQPGDVFVTNDPYRGGSHLPDVTVVTPVHDENKGSSEPLFFTASRAHHAEIGGATPGSMPPFSQSLAEEGVLIRNFQVVDAGRDRFDALRQLLSSGAFPSRAVDDNLADLSAQIAANQQGARDLLELINVWGQTTIEYMQHIQDAAALKTRAAIRTLENGTRRFEDQLDDGSRIAVRVEIADEELTIDFNGTSDVQTGNLNANRAIVTAAVLYTLRCLIGEDIPLNQGVLEPVHLILPEGLLNPPSHDDLEQCPAVAGGNVETSQRVVDVLLGALEMAAASQGTMNNLLFGDGKFGYYETICGGEGATPTRNGAHAVHTHMTNTRITDPEILEQRYPVRLLEFLIRRGSGGAGQHRGGDGVIRRLEFLTALQVSLLTSRRSCRPFGLHGGDAGKPGRNVWESSKGATILDGRAQFTVAAGDRLTIFTPGGGGYGNPDDER